jgi:hypothetical protein
MGFVILFSSFHSVFDVSCFFLKIWDKFLIVGVGGF